MKKILIGGILLSLFFLTGCVIYGSGETNGYVTTIEEGIFWDMIWFRADLASSNTDCYVIKDDNLKTKLKEFSANKQRITLKFNRHIATLSLNCNDDEVIGYSIIGGGQN